MLTMVRFFVQMLFVLASQSSLQWWVCDDGCAHANKLNQNNCFPFNLCLLVFFIFYCDPRSFSSLFGEQFTGVHLGFVVGWVCFVHSKFFLHCVIPSTNILIYSQYIRSITYVHTGSEFMCLTTEMLLPNIFVHRQHGFFVRQMVSTIIFSEQRH